MRSTASGAAFHHAFLHATQQAFLEAHERAFAFFCDVFRKLRYENLTGMIVDALLTQADGMAERDAAMSWLSVSGLS